MYGVSPQNKSSPLILAEESIDYTHYLHLDLPWVGSFFSGLVGWLPL